VLPSECALNTAMCRTEVVPGFFYTTGIANERDQHACSLFWGKSLVNRLAFPWADFSPILSFCIASRSYFLHRRYTVHQPYFDMYVLSITKNIGKCYKSYM